jgi:putative membrane protein
MANPEKRMGQVYSYAIHLLSAFALIAGFAAVYLKVTPYAELALIREGNIAALLSFGGALLGFSLTLASSIAHNSTLLLVVAWAFGAMIVQVLTYAVLSHLMPAMNHAIEERNVAMGGLMGCTSLVVGIINAACLT